MKFLPGLFEGKSLEDATSHALSASGSARARWYTGGGDWDTSKAVAHGYEKVLWVYRCTDAIATNLSSIPIILRKGDQWNGVIIQHDVLHRLLNIRANPYENAQQFKYRVITLALLSRRGVFIEVVGGLKNPTSLHIIPPTTCEPIPHPEKFVAGYKVDRAEGGYDILEPDQVIWLRMKPHPTDPYSQMTPLVAAGLAVETDWLARMYNRNYLLNDGRPGLLVTVRGQISKEDADELQRRFSGGSDLAGRTTVIEGDGLDVADMSASPRDVQWMEAVRGSKEDLLLAFGTPESVLGNASGRTFDNADAEREGWWKDTLVPYGNAFTSSLDVLTGDLNDDINLTLNYNVVDVLQRQETERQQRAREDWIAGKITWNEMRRRTGEEEWPDAVAGNIIVLPSGFAMAKNPEDQAKIMDLPNVNSIGPAAIGEAGAAARPALPSGPRGTPPNLRDTARAGALEGAQIGSRRFNNIIAARTMNLRDRAQQMRFKTAHEMLTRIESKSEHDVEYDDEDDVVDGEIVAPYEEARVELEAKAEAVLETFDMQMTRVIPERVMHTKVRKGTRHWEYTDAEEKAAAKKPLDPKYIVDADRWTADVRSAFETMLRPILTRELERAGRDMKNEGVLQKMIDEGRVSGRGKTPLLQVLNDRQADVDNIVQTALDQVLDKIEKSARNKSSEVEKLINELDGAGRTANYIQDAIRKKIGDRSKWRKNLAVAMTTSGIETVRCKAYERAGRAIRKTWNSQNDESVRASHRQVSGQTRSAGEHFMVGGHKMLHPGDATAPASEVANCRCWTSWSYGYSR